MADKNKSAQKSRTSKTSKGTARGCKPMAGHLTPIQLILMGKGVYATWGKTSTKRGQRAEAEREKARKAETAAIKATKRAQKRASKAA